MREVSFLLIMSLLYVAPAIAQSPNATINGIVLDPSGAAIAGAQIVVVNDATGVQYTAKTNGEGIYVVPNIPPGPYRIQVSNSGFKTIIKPDIVIHVQDALAINFTLPIGAASEVVTVQGGAPLINTENAAVSTVIDRKFVESLPLNGRSFNTLLQLTPGVIIVPSSSQNPGQFSINGQRTDANYFQVDGVSVNFGASAKPFLYQGGNGGAQAFNAYGGTSSLVSVDAMQEFRVQTSSFAPEFGHSPGGQVSITTRSGTNDFHGTAFDYFRNDVLDANDWFANQVGKARAPERQNDFGGVLGGPVLRDTTFFFLSYEGLRLRQPQTTRVQVPTVGLRNSAVPAAAPILAAFPLPDDPNAVGVTSPFTGVYSNSISMDAGSFRLDRFFRNGLGVFGRFNWAPSFAKTRQNSLNNIYTTNVNTRTATAGANYQLSPRLNNAFRINFSKQSNDQAGTMDSFGGATPIATSLLLPSPYSLLNNDPFVSLLDAQISFHLGHITGSTESQFDVLDDLSYSIGAHQLKMGFDYRQLSLQETGSKLAPQYYVIPTGAFATSGTIAEALFTASRGGEVLLRNTGAYIQDTWKQSRRLTLTYGLRWEVNPAPSPQGGTVLSSWENVENPLTTTLAPAGTPVYGTTYKNFAPRVGVAYSLDERGSLVIRSGWGIFYDLGTGVAPNLLQAYPNFAFNFSLGVTLPVPNYSTFAPTFPTGAPFSSDGVFVFDPRLMLPYANEWNVSIEKSLQERQSVTVSYVGQSGRRLLRSGGIPPGPSGANFPIGYHFLHNGSSSDYNALQVQYKRPLYRRVQALLNYTWSHSIDNSSDNGFTSEFSQAGSSASTDRGSSDFDVRHNFSGTVTVDLPSAKGAFLRELTENWSLAGLIQARSGLPISIFTTSIPGVGTFVNDARPDLTPGMPIWVPDPTTGPGKKLNVNAFASPPTTRQGNLPRNSILGLGISQIDISTQRSFPIREKFRISFRTDAFNILNHPNFTNPNGDWEPSSTSFGVFTQMLNRGLGGLNALYQIGGPRSLQLSLRLAF